MPKKHLEGPSHCILTKGLFFVLNGLFSVLVSAPLGILILLDIQYNASWPTSSCKNLLFSILFSFHQWQASNFLLVDSCRARAQLSRAVLKTSWFQKLTNILSSARSLPKKTTIQNWSSPLRNIRLLHCRCKWIMICKVLLIVRGSKGDYWCIFQLPQPNFQTN